MSIEIPLLTDEQLRAEVEDMMAEHWVDLMEVEEPILDDEIGFAQEFLRECD